LDGWQEKLSRFIDAQPAWSDFPILVLTAQADTTPNIEILRNIANVTLLNRPIRIQSLIAAVQACLRDRQRQYTVRDLLNSLADRERLIRQQADAMPNIVFAADELGNLDYVNRTAVEYIGVKDVQLLGEGWVQALHPDDRDRAVARWQKAISTGQNYQVEFRIRRDDTNEYRWHIARGVPARDQEGAIVRWFGTCTDIHEQKLIQQRLNQALDAAAAASIAKSEFIANMSHEIRTPMTAVLGYAELLANNETEAEKLAFLRTIQRNGEFLLEIINDILDLSKIEAGKLEISRQWFEPYRLVHDVQSMMQGRASEKRLEFPIEFDGKVPRQINSDPKRLRQILVNLVGNAIKFTESGSVRLVMRYDGKRLHFDVIDTGIGMTSEQQTRLFQPFTQGDASVDRKYGGTGLGLAISQRLAQMLGGKISVKSQPGKGTTFSFRIALGTLNDQELIDPPVTLADAKDDRPDLPRLSCRILVVDDRRDVRMLAGHFLRRSGAEVIFAEDGQEATEIVESTLKQGSPLSLVLMDMQMPGMDGYRAASRLRELGFGKPIIALTADAMQGDMDRCIASGCNAYLSKPIDAHELIRVVSEYTS
jgi:PAS domain S-box-containing protein